MFATFTHTFNQNTSQSFQYENNILMIAGERCAIINDGGLEIIALVAGYESQSAGNADGWSKLQTVSYQSSEKNLRWYETMFDFLVARGSFDDLERVVLAGRINLYNHDIDMLARFEDFNTACDIIHKYGHFTQRLSAAVSDKRAVSLAHKVMQSFVCGGMVKKPSGYARIL